MSAHESPLPVRRVPGEPGLWVFLLLDLLVFTVFFGTILVLRDRAPEAFAAGQDALHPALAALNTVLLVTGSVFVVRAVEAARAGAVAGVRRLLLLGAATGVAFIGVKAYEYADLVDAGHSMRDGDFFLCYFAFTGVHLVHVALGTGLLLAVAGRARRRPLRPEIVEGAGAYWHLVDLLWLVLFPLLYLST
ncbi:MAG TPA: cytochrome c oxidase subunit 3 [Baekduia sp.]|nr:cytochrome c oxidase subunit 3 [Baekduia sp.]